MSITIHEELFLYLIVSMVLSLAISPLSVFLAKRMNLIDIPRSTAHKQHAEVTPVVGGTILILVLAIMVSAAGLWKEELIRVILFGAVIIYFFGLGDDVYGFSAPQKLIGQLLAAALLISNGLSVKFFHSFGEIFLPDKIILWMDIGLTILWLVGITNAMNLIDSMDGLVVGLTIITSLFFLFALLESGQPELVWLSVVVLGICLPLKLFNASPPKLFLGDSGAQTLGFLVAAMGMVYTPRGLNPLSTWFVPILLLIVPIFDTTLVVISRALNNKSIFRGSLDHSYHRLVSLGIASSRAVYGIHLVAIFFSSLAFIMMRLNPVVANIGFGLIIIIGAIMIIAAQGIKIYPDENEPPEPQA